MPGILAEVSFVSSPTDEQKLRSDGYREQIAEALYRGIARYAATSRKGGGKAVAGRWPVVVGLVLPSRELREAPAMSKNRQGYESHSCQCQPHKEIRLQPLRPGEPTRADEFPLD